MLGALKLKRELKRLTGGNRKASRRAIAKALSKAKFRFELDGMHELERTLNKLEKIPQSAVTKAAKAGMKITLNDAKSNAPVDTGQLKKGIKLKAERSKVKPKKVYRVVFDEKMNHVFQKKDKDGKVIGYYPISQEYGYFARNGKYIPGYQFIHKAFNGNQSAIRRTIIKEMGKQVDKAMK